MRSLLRRGRGEQEPDPTTDADETGESVAARPESADDSVGTLTRRSRKRFARRQWRRRWLAWKYVIALVLVIILLCVAIWAVYFSSWLQVKGVDVQGDLTMATPQQVEKYADVPTGKPLVTADLDAVRIRVLSSLPVVRSVDVSREWPDKILVKVTERTPVAVVSIGGRLRALDETGTVFWHYSKAPAGLPRVASASGTTTEALAQAAKVASALPKTLADRVDHVEVATVDSISLSLRGGGTVVWGSSAGSAAKADDLLALLKSAPHAARYDVSVPGQPATSGTRR